MGLSGSIVVDCAVGDSKPTKQPLSEKELWGTDRSEASFCSMVMMLLISALRKMGASVFLLARLCNSREKG